MRGTGQAPSNPLSESPVLEESFALLHPEAEWDSLLREEPFRGREEIQKGVEDWLDSIDNWRVSVEQAVDAGSDRVLVLLRASIHGKGSDVSTSQRLFIVVTVREGRVAGIADYTESEEALEAAGLSE